MTTIVCPNCGYHYTPGDLVMMPGSILLDDRFEEECVECGAILVVNRELTATYYVEKKEVPS